jgi:hypothetical protein
MSLHTVSPPFFMFILPIFLPVFHGPAGQGFGLNQLFNFPVGWVLHGVGWEPHPGSWVPSWLTLYQNPDGGYQHKIKCKNKDRTIPFLYSIRTSTVSTVV